MPAAVKEALEEVVDDKKFIDKMIENGKLQEETWS